MSSKRQFSAANDSIQTYIGKLIGQSVTRTIKKLEKEVIALHRQMFVYLVRDVRIINSFGPPSFPGISLPQPSWIRKGEVNDPNAKGKTTEQFLNLRKGSKRPDRFFFDTGYLQEYFLSIANPFNNFGRPKIIYVRPGKGGSRAEYIGTVGDDFKEYLFDNKGVKTNKFSPLKTKLGSISIDLYPKVKEKLNTGMKMGPKYFPKMIAYRLDNFQGGQHRTFMPQYMEWWLKSKMKARITRITK